MSMSPGDGARRPRRRQDWNGAWAARVPKRGEGPTGPTPGTGRRLGDAHVGLKGDLGELALSDLVEMMSMGDKTGRLVLSDGGGRVAGELAFRDGLLVAASRGSLRGEKAFYALLDMREGTFDFDGDAYVDDESCNLRAGIQAASLLVEGMRRLDEIQQMRARYPAPAVVRLQRAGAGTDDASEARVLAHVGPGARTVGDVVEGILVDGEFDEYDALKAIGRLADSGIVAVQIPRNLDGGTVGHGGPPQPELER